MIVRNLFILCAFFSIVPILVQAQSNDENDRLFQNYITKNQFYMSQISLKAKRIFVLTYPRCNKDIQTTRLKPIVIIPRIFEKPKITDESEKVTYNFPTLNPSRGQWVERAVLNACGQAAQINMLVTAYNLDKIPEIYPLMNGQTKIEIIDQSKAENIIKSEIRSATKCQSNSFVVGTSFMGFRDPVSNTTLSKTNKNAGWVEQWIVNACDQDMVVNLAVLPDPRTRYRYVAKIKGK